MPWLSLTFSFGFIIMIDLPEKYLIKKITKSLATLDLILEPEWQYRYYSYNSKWSKNEKMASMRNGSGDEWFILFHDGGWAGLKGFDHESPAASIEGVSKLIQSSVPHEMKAFSEEPAFSWSDTTFAAWSEADEAKWTWAKCFSENNKPIEGGANVLLKILQTGPDGYKKFAEDYFEREVDINCISDIFQHQPLTPKLINSINNEVDLENIKSELDEIEYPYK